MIYGNFTAELFGHKQRPWGYEIRIDVTYNPTGEKHPLTMTFRDGQPTQEEAIARGKARLDNIQYKIDNPPDLAAEWKTNFKEIGLRGVEDGHLTMNQALRINAIVEE